MSLTDAHPPPQAHPDVPAEQAVIDHAYRCLAAMRARTEAAMAVADNAAQEVDAAIARAHLAQRLRALQVDVPGLSFGRLDSEDGEHWYVGRRHVEDDTGEAVVVDWRAPVSTPFYRATAADPLELSRRRRFLMSDRTLDDIDDEVFDDPDSVHAAKHGGIPDPLLVELERSRTGAMRDIVATIAAEQDVIIRAGLDTCLVVQGGPGTGKTAVGLHRAAFLLYEHRERLDRDGVLVVGPNPIFLRYIAQVLPSLGEAATRQLTMEGLVSGVSYRVRALDSPARARLLGDARMAGVLRAALVATLRPPEDDVVVPTAYGTVVLAAGDVRAAVTEIVDRGVPFATGRTALRTRMHRMAWQRHQAARGARATPPDEFDRALRAAPDFGAAVGRIWPNTSGPTLARRVLTNRAALAAASDGLLSPDEQALVVRKGARKADDEPWTLAELVLVDEAEALVNGVARTYGHVVADEAQDLSAMELRALARRCPSRSMTVLGDLAQATSPASQVSWDEALEHLGSPAAAAVEELTLGYRVPGPVMDLANRLLPHVAPSVTPSGSVRVGGREAGAVRVAPDDLGQAVRDTVRDLAGRWGSVAVIAPGAVGDLVAAALADGGIDAARGRAAGHGEAVTLLTPPEAKGLEFDAVVVVEPAAFMDDDAVSGGRLLYIALTRAVQELGLVTSRPMPMELGDLSELSTDV